MYGSIIGQTRYPQFIKVDEYKIFTKALSYIKVCEQERKLVQLFCFLDPIQHIEAITFHYFNQIYPDKKKQRVILYMLQKAKKVIPLSYCIGDTFLLKWLL